MYYYYPCPKCGHSISDWEKSDYKEELNLVPLVKAHYAQEHTPGELLMTDSELAYDIKENMKATDTRPIG